MFKNLLSAFVVLTIGLMFFPSVGQSAGKDKKEEPKSAWAVRCNEKKDEKDKDKGRCEAYQRLAVKETGQRVVEFAIGYPDDKKAARGVIILPLGLLLPEGVQMRIDDGAAFKFQIRYCTAEGCFAYLNLNEAVLDTMRKGTDAVVIFKTIQGQDMSIAMSLSGFSKALKEIQ